MRGLLEKDIRLLRTRKNAILVFLVMMAILGFSAGGTFVIGYGTMLFGILAIGTISYDEFDNGMPFIMSLPITKKDYVQEKYVFTGSLILAGWLASVIICLIIGQINGEAAEILGQWKEMLSLFPLFWALSSIMLLLELKFGIEKSRTVMMVVAGGVFAVGMIGGEVFSDEVPTLFQMIANAPDGVILGTILAISAVVLLVTYVICCQIMEKKEY